MKKYQEQNWTTAPISQTCEKLHGLIPCGCPTSWAYPASGGGWMALCQLHGKPHIPHVFTIEELIESGEVFE